MVANLSEGGNREGGHVLFYLVSKSCSLLLYFALSLCNSQIITTTALNVS
jgi:hypothetical protein